MIYFLRNLVAVNRVEFAGLVTDATLDTLALVNDMMFFAFA
jgi:hypothetical protein